MRRRGRAVSPSQAGNGKWKMVNGKWLVKIANDRPVTNEPLAIDGLRLTIRHFPLTICHYPFFIDSRRAAA
jgi:hypothetical protein